MNTPNPISSYDLERISQFVFEDYLAIPDLDIPESIGMIIENIPDVDLLSEDKIEKVIPQIVEMVDGMIKTNDEESV